MNKFIVIEVGSINTKTYLYEDKIKDLGIINIDFKNNYNLNKKIDINDLNKLYEHIGTLKKYECPIYVFGTNIFRELDNLERGNLLKEFKDQTNLDFIIITKEMENELIVSGVVSELDYNGRLAVMIGSGSTTEVSIIEDKKVIEVVNNNYGVTDICSKYSDINSDTATSLLKDIIEDTYDITKIPNNKSELLVLAGSDYLKFYETLNYPLNRNKFYQDNNQAWYLDTLSMYEYDKDFFYHKSLLEIQNENFSTRELWNGSTRGIRVCVNVIAKAVDAKYVIPTRITMINGIVNKIKNS